MDPRTQTRYDNAKNEGVIEYLSAHARSEELEQIGHEEDGLKVLRALEAEGWMKVLFPAWTSAKADEAKLTALHDLAVQLLVQGVHPDMSAAQMHLLTAKLPSKDLSALKKSMLRPGFVEEWNNLDSLATGFAKVLLSKQNAKPSAGYKLFMSYDPEAILWLGFTSKDKAVQERFNLFLKVWPEARQRIPYVLMQEMRITPELPGYADLVQKIFLELIDGHLTTPEEMRAFLEPYSPPAPPPQVTIKRSRAKRAEAKIKEQAFDEDEEGEEEGLLSDEDTEAIGDDEELDLSVLPKGALAGDEGDDAESDEDEEEAGEKPAAPAGKKKSQAVAPVKKGPAKAETPAPAAKPAPEPPAAKGKPACPVKARRPGKGRAGSREACTCKDPSGSRSESETACGHSRKACQAYREKACTGQGEGAHKDRPEEALEACVQTQAGGKEGRQASGEKTSSQGHEEALIGCIECPRARRAATSVPIFLVPLFTCSLSLPNSSVNIP